MSSPTTLREVIAKAIFEEPTQNGNIRPGRHWCDLSSHHREGWLKDADRVLASMAEWAREAGRYFNKRPTHGEDRAFWANTYNAENANKLGAFLEALIKESLTTAPGVGNYPEIPDSSGQPRPPSNSR